MGTAIDQIKSNIAEIVGRIVNIERYNFDERFNNITNDRNDSINKVNKIQEQLDQLGNLKKFEGRHVKQTSNFLQPLDSLLVKLFLVFGLANVEHLVGVNGPNESVA